MDTRVQWQPHNWRIDLARGVAGTLGSVLTLTIAGWPTSAAAVAWLGVGGFVIGFLIALVIEYVVRLHGEVSRLQQIERQLASERQQRERERELRDYQLMLANRRAAVAETGTQVLGGMLDPETASASVLRARLDMMLKAKGLDKPPPAPPAE